MAVLGDGVDAWAALDTFPFFNNMLSGPLLGSEFEGVVVDLDVDLVGVPVISLLDIDRGDGLRGYFGCGDGCGVVGNWDQGAEEVGFFGVHDGHFGRGGVFEGDELAFIS